MMKLFDCPFALALACTTLTFTACGESDEEDNSIEVAWTFASGDCASSGVETVRVTWGPKGGDTQEAEFPCGDSSGSLGEAGDGYYTFIAEGLDESGAVVAKSYGTSGSFSGGVPGGHAIHVTLQPASADVTVSWTLNNGEGCPDGVILPYFITLYEAPTTAGAEPTVVAAEAQEACSAGEATLSNVAPGHYIVELDSRAVTPLVFGTAEVTVEAGQDVGVEISF